MTPDELRDCAVTVGLDIGFARVGIVDLKEVPRYAEYQRWLERGYHGTMEFLESEPHIEGRKNPRNVLATARSAVVVAAAYEANIVQAERGTGQVALYALGDDYHFVVKDKLRALAAELERRTDSDFSWRACVDTAPVLERALAERAGIGFVGKNTMLISPGVGSFTVLGELFTDLEMTPTPPLETDHCGSCTACLDVCPTGAFAAPYLLDSRRCISYLTIEHRESIAIELREAIGNRIFGCDDCQSVCPYNQRAPQRTRPLAGLERASSPRLRPLLRELVELRSGDYRRLTKQSAMSRARRAMLRRNAALALGNQTALDEDERAALAHCLADSDIICRRAAAWALGQHGARDLLEEALASEADQSVRAEITAALSRATSARVK